MECKKKKKVLMNLGNRDADIENEMDLRIWGGGRVSWDEVREWHGLIYTTKCKIDS